jgi:hypothetical protein
MNFLGLAKSMRTANCLQHRRIILLLIFDQQGREEDEMVCRSKVAAQIR